jgi:hypothetical protein
MVVDSVKEAHITTMVVFILPLLPDHTQILPKTVADLHWLKPQQSPSLREVQRETPPPEGLLVGKRDQLKRSFRKHDVRTAQRTTRWDF